MFIVSWKVTGHIHVKEGFNCFIDIREEVIVLSSMPKFEIYKDAAGKFRFRLKAPNGETIASGEAYATKDGCKGGIESVKTNAPKATIVDMAQ
jgi:uncharacterized protein YegP (UPF0339 family)